MMKMMLIPVIMKRKEGRRGARSLPSRLILSESQQMWTDRPEGS